MPMRAPNRINNLDVRQSYLKVLLHPNLRNFLLSVHYFFSFAS